METEKQYIDLFTEYEDIICLHAAEAPNVLRRQALADFERLGFPAAKDEDYRYTDVSAAFAANYGVNLHRLAVPVDASDVFRCDVPNLDTALYFVVNDLFYTAMQPDVQFPEGVFVGDLKTFDAQHPGLAARYFGKAADTGRNGIIALNTMFAQDAFVVYVPRNVRLKRPVQLVNVFRSHADMMVNRRILVILEPCAEAKLLVCDHSMSDIRSLGTQVVEIFAGEDAFFDYYDLEESHRLTTRFASVYVEQAARSNVLVNGITLNNGLTRNDYHITLNGEGAETILCGMTIQDGNQHVDTRTHIVHAAPRCTSRELFKYMLQDRATGAFCGRITVREGADKTMAEQTNRNLCTGREAVMYSKPQLEIYADDVKCSHGMSTGQLDEQALFYMRSRGLPEDEARLMLSVAFMSEVTDHIRLDGLKDRLSRLVEKRFRGEFARCAGYGICRNNRTGISILH
ncbi:MAG: Fe-S cluster assembly protein SufD [Tannerella sp.]|nr:Fe-S cluster assembly protein SufD [Tannerella sp.]